METSKKRELCNFKVVSDSMAPFINAGESLVAKFIRDPREICVGDIVLYESKKCLVAHRIITKFTRQGKIYFRQKGDACLTSGIICGDEIIGKVISVCKPKTDYSLEALRLKAAGVFLGTFFRCFDHFYRGVQSAKSKLLSEKTGRIYNGLHQMVKAVVLKSHMTALVLYAAIIGMDFKKKMSEIEFHEKQGPVLRIKE